MPNAVVALIGASGHQVVNGRYYSRRPTCFPARKLACLSRALSWRMGSAANTLPPSRLMQTATVQVLIPVRHRDPIPLTLVDVPTGKVTDFLWRYAP